jgi:hypothetical protein
MFLLSLLFPASTIEVSCCKPFFAYSLNLSDYNIFCARRYSENFKSAAYQYTQVLEYAIEDFTKFKEALKNISELIGRILLNFCLNHG